MSLSNAASFVVLPPLNLIGLTILGVLLSFRTRRLGQVLGLVGILGIAVLGMPVTSNWLIARLEDGLPLVPDPAHPPGAIVILGGDVSRQANDGSTIGPLSLGRVRAGAALARRTGLPILVTGGVTNDDTADVCKVMADSLRDDFNVPARWTECRSIDTWENAAMSAPLLRADGIGSIYLLSDGWHLRRGLLAFQPTGLHVTAAPSGFDPEPSWHWEGFVPSPRSLLHSYWAVHEWVGIAYYRWRLRGAG